MKIKHQKIYRFTVILVVCLLLLFGINRYCLNKYFEYFFNTYNQVIPPKDVNINRQNFKDYTYTKHYGHEIWANFETIYFKNDSILIVEEEVEECKGINKELIWLKRKLGISGYKYKPEEFNSINDTVFSRIYKPNEKSYNYSYKFCFKNDSLYSIIYETKQINDKES